MTEKRFTFTQDTLAKADVFDGDEFVCCTLSVWVEQLVDLLNQINNENEQLKFELHKLNILYKAKCKTEEQLLEMGKEVEKENEQLKKENKEYKALLQDLGLQMSDEEVINIRNEISDKILKPMFEANGFDVDINTDDGFTIIPKGDVE